MNTKAMEAAKEITNLREIEMYTAEEIAAIISKHFPEPSVSVSELEALRQQRDAALKLADKWEVEAKDTLKSNTVRFAFYGCADELRAIYADKEQA